MFHTRLDICRRRPPVDFMSCDVSQSHRPVPAILQILLFMLAATALACSSPAPPSLAPTLVPSVSSTARPTATLAVSPTPVAMLTRGGSQLLLNAQGQNAAYSGVCRVHGSGECSGAFVQTVQDDAATDAPAYVLTAGHCAWAIRPNEVLIDWVDEEFYVVFDYFYDTQDRAWFYPVKKIAYATVKGRDIAVLELDATYGQLADKGYQPLQVSDVEAEVGAPVAVVGAPIEEIPEEERYLRIAFCHLDEQVDLIEGAWHFYDEYRNDCADIHHGSSGSPVISRTTGRLVALLNTSTTSPYGDCYANRPCEVTERGPVVREMASYAVPVSGIDRCFDASGRFQWDLPDCPLAGGRGLRLAGQPDWATQPYSESGDGLVQRVTWNATVAGKYYRYFRYKIGPVGLTDCRDLYGYGPVFHIVESSHINEPLPETEGFYALCLLSGNSPQFDGTWQDPSLATMIQISIDTTPPSIQPNVEVLELPDSWRLSYRYSPPEIEQYMFKIGKPDDTECDDSQGYVVSRQGALRLYKDQGPYKVCAIARDRAGNPGTPEAWILE